MTQFVRPPQRTPLHCVCAQYHRHSVPVDASNTPRVIPCIFRLIPCQRRMFRYAWLLILKNKMSHWHVGISPTRELLQYGVGYKVSEGVHRYRLTRPRSLRLRRNHAMSERGSPQVDSGIFQCYNSNGALGSVKTARYLCPKFRATSWKYQSDRVWERIYYGLQDYNTGIDL